MGSSREELQASMEGNEEEGEDIENHQAKRVRVSDINITRLEIHL